MRKVLSIGMLVLAILALATAGVYACEEKSTSAKKADTDATVKQVNAEVKAGSDAQYTCSAAKKSLTTAMADKATADDKWLTRTIAVKGMTCAGCENSVSAALAKAPGVVEVVKVCHKSEEAVVKVNPALSTDAELTKVITNKGYEAQIIPAVAKSTNVQSKGYTCPLSGGPGCPGAALKTSAEKKPEDTK